MNCLIVEDDLISRRVLKELITSCLQCNCDIAVNGEEALISFRLAHEANKPYGLICMDIMMPGMDGQEAVRHIREMEKELGVPPYLEAKIIMTTALDCPKAVIHAFYRGGATSYLVKPIGKDNLVKELRQLRLLA